jgi:uncharacterized protein
MMSPLRKKMSIVSRWALLAVVCLLSAGRVALAQTTVTAPLPIPRDAAGKVTPVGDFANVIDDATEQRLANILKNLSDKQGIEYAVVTVGTTNGQEVFDYSLALMRGWGVGSEEKQGQTARPGLLTLVAVNDRKFFTQASRHLEGDLPDSVVARIQRENLVPLMRQGRPSEAIFGTAQAFVGEMARKRGFNVEGLDQKYIRQAPAQSPQSGGGGAGKTICLCLIIVFVLFILLIIISRKSGGGNGDSSGWGGGGFGGNGRYANQDRGGGIIPVPIIIGGGGWGGGDSGGGSDWGSSDWGGFSGGGGDAGGGGAGGDW